MTRAFAWLEKIDRSHTEEDVAHGNVAESTWDFRAKGMAVSQSIGCSMPKRRPAVTAPAGGSGIR